MPYVDRKEVSGKLISELKELETELSKSAVFAVSQDNLTRKVSLSNIIEALSIKDGDKYYYTADQIDKMIQDIFDKLDEFYNSIRNLTQDVEDLRDRIEDIYNNIMNILNDLYDYGTEIPTRLRKGKYYFQYFEDSLLPSVMNFYNSKYEVSTGDNTYTGCPIRLLVSGEVDEVSPKGDHDEFNLKVDMDLQGSLAGVNFVLSENDNYDIYFYSDDSYDDSKLLYSGTNLTYSANHTIKLTGISSLNTELIYAKIILKHEDNSVLFNWSSKKADITKLINYGFFVRSN